MQWSLFLLILMGHWSFVTCHLYQYHFINKQKKWDRAKQICRRKYTDLATVFDKSDMERLRKSKKNQVEAWIGLYNKLGKENRTWHWSLPGVKFNNETKWANNEPNDKSYPENCVGMENNAWKDFECLSPHTFICYDETQQSNKKFHLINSTMKWPNAQNYCREHHTDLVSRLSQLEEDEFKNETTTFSNVFWIGLFRDTWRWSDGNHSSFRNWDLQLFKDEEGTKKCAMTVSNRLTWNSDDCNKEKPFFCYDDNVVLIKKNMTWVEALYYCREKHYDLVSITDPHQQRWVQDRAKKASTSYVWLGLRYTCTLDFWFWVSDERVSYTNWASDGRNDDCDMSAAMESGGDHKWYTMSDDKKFNFICSKAHW